MRDIERRALVSEIQIEARDDGKKILRGHAAVFNSLSEDLGGFREQILPGAFADALETDDVRLLINHDGLPLARNRSGTLKLSEDTRGLAFTADLDENDPDVQRLLPKLARGDVNQMSFAFQVKPGGQDWAKDDDGKTIRTLKKLRLQDVSIVTFPAYPQTDAAMRELRAWQETLREPTPYNLLRTLNQRAKAPA